MYALFLGSITLPVWFAALMAVLLVLTGGYIFKNNPLKGAKTLDDLESKGQAWLSREKTKLKAKLLGK